MDTTREEREHVRAILNTTLGASWARAANIVSLVNVRRVTLQERGATRRRATLWAGPSRLTQHLQWVELEPSDGAMGRRAVCLDVMTTELQSRVSAKMDGWARESRSYPVVSVSLEGERVAEVHFAGSRRVALIGMRGARLLAVYERGRSMTAALYGSVAGAGVAACVAAAHLPLLTAATLGLSVALAVTLWDTLKRPAPLRG